MTHLHYPPNTGLPEEPASLHIAGDTLNGGGQLVRLAIGLSALTRKSVMLDKIRANRPGDGGLKSQHVAALDFLRDATGAVVVGGSKGSERVKISYPNQRPATPEVLIKSRDEDKAAVKEERVPRLYTLPDGTQHLSAQILQPKLGSIGLVFQALLPILLFYSSPTNLLNDKSNQYRISLIGLAIIGGTNAPLSPSIDYVIHVLLPTLAKIGFPPITAGIKERGWSTGGELTQGSADFSIQPLPRGQALKGFTLERRGSLASVHAIVIAPNPLNRTSFYFSNPNFGLNSLTLMPPSTSLQTLPHFPSPPPSKNPTIPVAYTLSSSRPVPTATNSRLIISTTKKTGMENLQSISMTRTGVGNLVLTL
ncbi:EPT/RTPC-like protein [Zopfia rhizophila CBS 207.26]|uniref:EPT/RTPC-like protein n=1 Tax=Zopfia rhizophila CBS 207.26 TaxID=1314779 RepID=A0A6A6E5K9_9PEZI|nr:EPT/RTPC-like protein [Zopfia rhizophila CBS 207.26]